MWIVFWTHVTFLRNIWRPSDYLIRQLRMEPVEEKIVNVCYKPRYMALSRNEERIHRNVEVKKNIVTQGK
jgi:hypothetical protein